METQESSKAENSTFKAVIETITPEQAKKYLKKGYQNRQHLDKKYVQKLAEDMKNGKWKTSAEPIIFSEDNTLLDGQHRLAALVLSEMTEDFLVIRGFNEHAVDKWNGLTFSVPAAAFLIEHTVHKRDK